MAPTDPARSDIGELGAVSYFWADMAQPAFWIAVGQIIWINILLSGDNAVVIAMAKTIDEDS